LLKRRKNYIAYVKKNPLRRCRFHLPLRRNCHSIAIGSNSFFAVLPLVDNQSAFWSLHPYVYGKTFPAFLFSSATAKVATEQKNGNGTTARQNGTLERRNGRTATEWWKLGISPMIVSSGW